MDYGDWNMTVVANSHHGISNKDYEGMKNSLKAPTEIPLEPSQLTIKVLHILSHSPYSAEADKWTFLVIQAASMWCMPSFGLAQPIKHIS